MFLFSSPYHQPFSTALTAASAIRGYRFIHSQKPVPESDMLNRKLLMERYFRSPSEVSDPFYSHYAFFADADAEIDPMRDAFMMSQIGVYSAT